MGRLLVFALVLWALALAALPPSSSAAARRSVADRTPARWGSAQVDVTRYLPAAEIARYRAYRQRQRRIDLLALGLDLLIDALLLGALGRGIYSRAVSAAATLASRWPFAHRARLGALGERVLGPDFGAALLFAAAYFALGVLLDLPLAIWHTVLAREAGLSTVTAGLWIRDTLVALSFGAVAFALLVVGLFGLVRRFPRRWWLLLGPPVALALAATILLAPAMTRVNHRVVPLERSRFAQREALATQLRALARARGVTLSTIKVIDTSRRGRALNAYVEGIGPTRELVIADTLLSAASDREVTVAVAHELGHVGERFGLVLRAIASALALLAFMALLAWALRRGARWRGLESPADVRLLPLIGLCSMLVFNLGLPLSNALSRQRELEADKQALIHTADPEAFISLQVKVARRNRADVAPDTWVRLWLQTHPSLAERVGLARFYQRWLTREERPRSE